MFLAVPFAMTAGRAALSFGARAVASTVERAVVPVATTVAREVTREAGMVAAQVVGQQAVDQISSTINSTTSGPIGQAVGAVVTQAGTTALAMASGDVVGVVRGTVQQTVNQVHLAQAVTSGLLRSGGGDGLQGEPAADGVMRVAPGSVGVPSMTHADTVAASTASQQQAAAIAAVAPTLTVRAVSPTPLPVNTSHDTVPALQAHTPMDPVGPAVTQGAPQPIMQVAAAYQAREVEPQRVYNQDHAAMLPPVTLLQTDQSQLRVMSDPLPPPLPHQQRQQHSSSSSSTPIIVVGTVAVGGVLIFLWYRQRRA